MAHSFQHRNGLRVWRGRSRQSSFGPAWRRRHTSPLPGQASHRHSLRCGAPSRARAHSNVGRANREKSHCVSRFCYNSNMTIGITGPERKAPGRNAVVGLIVTAIFAGVCLILLALVGDFLVDWMWFSAIGYWQVFWTTIGAKAGVFSVVFTVTAVIVWANARLAVHLTRHRRVRLPVAFDWTLATAAPPPDLFEFIRSR